MASTPHTLAAGTPRAGSLDPIGAAPTTFDASRIADLLPSLRSLLAAAIANEEAKTTQGQSPAPESRAALAQQANALREALAQCRRMCDALPSGDIGLNEQSRLIQLLEERVTLNRVSLEAVAGALALESS